MADLLVPGERLDDTQDFLVKSATIALKAIVTLAETGIELANAETDLILGVVLMAGTINQYVPVLRRGAVLLTSGAAVTAGQRVTVDSNNKVVAVAEGGAHTGVLGYACQTVSAGDKSILVYVNPEYYKI